MFIYIYYTFIYIYVLNLCIPTYCGKIALMIDALFGSGDTLSGSWVLRPKCPPGGSATLVRLRTTVSTTMDGPAKSCTS